MSFRVPARLGPGPPVCGGLLFGAVLALELFRRHGEVPQRLIWPALMRAGRARFVPTSSRSVCAGAWRCSGCQRPSSSPRCCRACSLFSLRSTELRRLPRTWRSLIRRVSTDGEGLCGGRLTRRLGRHRHSHAVALRRPGRARATSGGQAIWAAIPRSRLIILPGVGHISSVEAPDRFCAEVRAFLTER
jgi:pimeloyl-ACP methyl ester carboxylesterase